MTVELSDESREELQRLAWSTHSLGPHARALLAADDERRCSARGCDETEDVETVRIGLVETKRACPDHRKDVLEVSS